MPRVLNALELWPDAFTKDFSGALAQHDGAAVVPAVNMPLTCGIGDLMYNRVLRVSRRAFTLVELMIVIGIIAVLIAILMPALGTAKEQANRIKCANNLRQIGACSVAFAADKGRVPFASQQWQTWIYSKDFYYLETLYGAADSLFVCPSIADANVVGGYNGEGNLQFGMYTAAQKAQWANAITTGATAQADDPTTGPSDGGNGTYEVYTTYVWFGIGIKDCPTYVNNFGQFPSEVWKLSLHTNTGTAADSDPPLAADVMLYQVPAQTKWLWKYNHGGYWNWNQAPLPLTSGSNPANGQNILASNFNSYPAYNSLPQSIYANTLFLDGHVEGRHPDPVPWMPETEAGPNGGGTISGWYYR
jgi:prepilin-type N-terminal cleavage/methylation domain-containing protein/prepilin-type processing-associated H-X9-DG protein